jgi:hypothetical protein
MDVQPRRAAPGPAPSTVRRRVRLRALGAGLVLLATAAVGTVLPGLATGAEPVTAPIYSADAESPTARPAPSAVLPAPDPAPMPSVSPSHTAPSIAGIPEPCPIDFPITADLSAADISERVEEQWRLRLTGSPWRDDGYRPFVELFAETLDAVDCTGYLERVIDGNGGTLEVSSDATGSWAWGDYGLTRANVLTLDAAKFRQGYADGDRGRLVRLVIHEMAHSLNADRFSEPAYWQTFQRVWKANGPVSAYGKTETESFADAVGYYVARCAADNPYATTEHAAYYEYVKTNIFNGREFGGAVGTHQECAIKGR